MNTVRTLITVFVGSLAIPSYAVSVDFKLESYPSTGWEFAQRDSAGATTTINVSDADGDGAASFEAVLGPLEGPIAIHISSGPAECRYIYNFFTDPATIDGSLSPFLGTVAGGSLILELIGPPSIPFSLGQRVNVTDGQIAGLDGVVHENPGITTALDLLAINVSALPRFTGEADVGGLLGVRVVPEPDTVALVLLSLASVGIGRRK